MDERLRQYLEECKKKKLAWEEVARVMEGSNYPMETITEAKGWYESVGVTVSPEPVKGIVEEKPGKKRRPGGILVMCLIILLLIVGLVYGGIYLVGARKIVLPNNNMQSLAEKATLAIPGVPKSPKVILDAVEAAHKKVTKLSFEISFSGQVQSSEIESLLGSKSIDMQIKGFSDMTDANDPIFNMNLIWGNEVDIDARKPDKMMYVKVNKVPVFVYTILGMDPVKIKPLWDNWIGIDTSKPETSARQKLDEAVARQSKQPEASEATTDILKKVMTDDILPSLKISEEKKNDLSTYKLSFTATPEQINKIAREIMGNEDKTSINPSEMLKTLSAEVWIDKNEKLVLEMDITASVEVPKNSTPTSSTWKPVLALTSEKQKMDMVIVVKMSDFGKNVVINKPDKYLSPEEFISEFMKLEPGGIWSMMAKMNASSSSYLTY